jgi:hypothetical protein
MRTVIAWAALSVALSAGAAELKLDFADFHQGQCPTGFLSTVMGEGKPGDWRLVLDDVPAPAVAGEEPRTLRRAVLAQLAQDPADEHFPLFIFEAETFGDFTLTTRFKTVNGKAEQMAGIAFRVQDEKNFYVVRASSLGNTLRFYKVLDGRRGPPIGPDLPIPAGVWHELAIQCKAAQIRCSFDGKELISVSDKVNALTSGKIGFWTKSDSVSYFVDTKIVYTPFQPPAQRIVREMSSHYPRLLGLKIYVPGPEPNSTRVVASQNETEIGSAGSATEQAVIGRAETYYGKEKDAVSVIMPLRDRNGEAIAAVRVVMKGFKGQTEENAIVRAAPIVKAIQGRIQSIEDLAEK